MWGMHMWDEKNYNIYYKILQVLAQVTDDVPLPVASPDKPTHQVYAPSD